MPVQAHTLLANAATQVGAGDGGSIREMTWTFADVSHADQMSFENALAVSEAAGPQALRAPVPEQIGGARPAAVSLGDSILNALADVKQRGDATQAEMVATLADSSLSSGDLLKVQFKLMGLSIELQTTSNMAHHGVEDVKTIMRGQ